MFPENSVEEKLMIEMCDHHRSWKFNWVVTDAEYIRHFFYIRSKTMFDID